MITEKTKRKPRWERMPFCAIQQNPELLAELKERLGQRRPHWPHRCGDEIRWK